MKQIRRGVFETNSSSTHALSMTKEIDAPELNSPLFEKEYIIKRFNEGEVDDVMELTSIEDKLRYFLTLYYQTSFHNDYLNSYRMQFMKALQNIFPNAIFKLDFDYCYVFEDGEWFFDDDDPECLGLIDENTLKKFMLYGTIYFGDRDREEYYDKIQRIKYDKNLQTSSWSG